MTKGAEGFTNRIKGLDSMGFAAPELGSHGPSGNLAEKVVLEADQVELNREELEKEILREFDMVFPTAETHEAILACLQKSFKKGFFGKIKRGESTRNAIANNIMEIVKETMVETVSQDIQKTEFGGDVNKTLRFGVNDSKDWAFNAGLNPDKSSDNAVYEISQDEEVAIDEVLKKFAATRKVSVMEHPIETGDAEQTDSASIASTEVETTQPTTAAVLEKTSPFYGKTTIAPDMPIPGGGRPVEPATEVLKVTEAIQTVAAVPTVSETASSKENGQEQIGEEWEAQYNLAISKIEEMNQVEFEEIYGKKIKPIETADYRQVILGMMQLKKEHKINPTQQSEITMDRKVDEVIKNLNTPGHHKKMVVVGNLSYWVDKEVKKQEKLEMNKKQEEFLVQKGNEFKKELEAEYSEEILEQEFPGELRKKHFELEAVIHIAKAIRTYFNCSGELAAKKAEELLKYGK